MATPTYRDVVQPSLIDTSIPSNGRVEAAEALAQTFADFARTGAGLVGDLRAEQGRREGAEAGRTNDPAFRTGMAGLTAYGQAYNDTAMRSYAIKSEIAADEAAAKLELESGNKPEHFRATFGARRDEILKEAPEMARPILGEIYDRRMAASMERIITKQHMEIKQQARTDVAEGLMRSTDRLAQLRASDNPAFQEQAEEEQIKIDLLIDGAMRDGTLSQIEGSALKVDSARRATQQTVLYRFRNELDNPYGSPVDFIGRLMKANKKSEALPPQEEEQLVNSLLQELHERNSLASMAQNRSDDARQQRWMEGNRTASKLLLDGRLSSSTLSRMVADDELDPNRATALQNDLEAGGGDRPDDARERFRVQTNLMSYTEEEIAENGSLSWQSRRELIEKRRDEESGWRGTQAGREASDRIDRALKILPGVNPASLSEEELEKRDRAMTHWYNAVESMPDDKRAAQIIPLAEETIRTIIRDEATATASEFRLRIQQLEAEIAKGEMDEEEVKTAQRRLDRYKNNLREAEAKTK